MNGLWTLVGHSLRRRRGLLLAGAVLLIVFQYFIIFAARSLHDSGGFLQIEALMPDFVKQWTNMTAASFSGFVLFGYSHPLVLLFLIAVAISVGTEPAAEVESKFIDLVMARPVSRAAPIARAVVVLIVATAVPIASMLIGTWSGLALFAPSSAAIPDMRVVVSLAANLGLLVLAWGGIALVFAAVATRRASAATACGFAAFAAFVLDYVGRFWEAAKPLSYVSPFHYFDAFAMIGGNALPLAHAGALTLVLAASATVAGIAYARRDL